LGVLFGYINDRVQTKIINSLFSAIPLLSKDLAKIQSGEPVDINQFSARVTSCDAGSNFLEDIKSMLNMIEIS